MIGGKVAQITRVNDCVAIRVIDPRPSGRADWCCVHVAPECPRVRVGDSLWWHGRKVYWTPKNGGAEDTVIQRIGYSHRDHDCGLHNAEEVGDG